MLTALFLARGACAQSRLERLEARAWPASLAQCGPGGAAFPAPPAGARLAWFGGLAAARDDDARAAGVLAGVASDSLFAGLPVALTLEPRALVAHGATRGALAAMLEADPYARCLDPALSVIVTAQLVRGPERATAFSAAVEAGYDLPAATHVTLGLAGFADHREDHGHASDGIAPALTAAWAPAPQAELLALYGFAGGAPGEEGLAATLRLRLGTRRALHVALGAAAHGAASARVTWGAAGGRDGIASNP